MNIENINKVIEGKSDKELVQAIFQEFPEESVLMSAFNPEDVILAAWAAEVNPATPIIFLDTKKHFPETLRYVDNIINQLGLTGVRLYEPKDELVKNIDSEGKLWQTQVNRCCWLRKVEPVNRGIEEGEFEILLTGRRIEQTPERNSMDIVEVDENERFKINPLKDWSRDQRDEYMKENNLPHHPLYNLGYLSIGCAPCTTPIFPGEHERAGRWRHTRATNVDDKGKTECGLHE